MQHSRRQCHCFYFSCKSRIQINPVFTFVMVTLLFLTLSRKQISRGVLLGRKMFIISNISLLFVWRNVYVETKTSIVKCAVCWVENADTQWVSGEQWLGTKRCVHSTSNRMWQAKNQAENRPVLSKSNIWWLQFIAMTFCPISKKNYKSDSSSLAITIQFIRNKD